jgi:hypothetical protein
MIPKDIQARHIEIAMDEIDRCGVPAGRDAQKFLVMRRDHKYPAKYVVALAGKHATGKFLSSDIFNGGRETNVFLNGLGFEICRCDGKPAPSTYLNTPPSVPKPGAQSQRATAHSERCPECKQRIEQLLRTIYGDVQRNPRINPPATPDSYKGTTVYDTLKSIYEALQKQRGHESFVRSESLPNCDFLVSAPGFLLEFDESQHFTASRKLSLSLYPKEGFYGFDCSRWVELCEKINARDNTPPFRDEQRAWYDTLRDLVPETLGMRPTVRLHADEFQWCSLCATNDEDISTFRQMIGERTNFWSLEFSIPKGATLARLAIDGAWTGSIALGQKLLNEVVEQWPSDSRVECLCTCGAFVAFAWPDTVLSQTDNWSPDKNAIETLKQHAQSAVERLLSNGLRERLSTLADYMTIGADTKKEKISSTHNHIPAPHAELVIVANLKSGELHFTGKSYPTTGQEKGLLRIQDLDSHFIELCGKETMVLGCHDLTIFNPRSDANATGRRAEVKKAFKATSNRRKPVQVLHHPHTAVKKMTWKQAWGGLRENLPSVKQYLGTGCYSYRDRRNGRDLFNDILSSTASDGVMNVLVHLASWTPE